MKKFNLVLENDLVKLVPLKEEDFESLFKVAHDPEIWAQHPNPDRYKLPVFQNFFKGALESKGAYLIFDKAGGQIIGSTRYYEPNEDEKSIFIGYTFFKKEFWGQGYNVSTKKLMLDFVFDYYDKVYFHIGSENLKSQRSIIKLKANKIREELVAYYGEPDRINFLYLINKSDWLINRSNL